MSLPESLKLPLSAALQGEIEALARARFGNEFCLRELTKVGGGCLSALRFSSAEHSVFVKLRPLGEQAMLLTQAADLAVLAQCQALRVPAVLGCVECDHSAALVLEWLDLHPLHDDDVAQHAGQALAALHGAVGEQFGWPHDNYLGLTRQINTPSDNWSRFFIQQRLQPLFERAAALGYKGDLQRNGERILAHAPGLFLEYRPAASLLHGDLWSGNIAALADGTPVLFDPASYYGDREADFAMSELFGGLPLAFYAAYRAATPLNEGYERRKTLYNLYHILNHLCLFGRGYLRQAERMAAELVRALMR